MSTLHPYQLQIVERARSGIKNRLRARSTQAVVYHLQQARKYFALGQPERAREFMKLARLNVWRYDGGGRMTVLAVDEMSGANSGGFMGRCMVIDYHPKSSATLRSALERGVSALEKLAKSHALSFKPRGPSGKGKKAHKAMARRLGGGWC